jgi:hypothetical protein
MSDSTNFTNAPLSSLLSVTGIGNGTTWCATTPPLAPPESEADTSTCSSPSVTSSSFTAIPSFKKPKYVDPGAFSDDDFEEGSYVDVKASGLRAPHVAQNAKKLNPGALSFVPEKAAYRS